MLPPNNPWPVTLILCCIALAFGFNWWSSQKSKSLAGALLSLGLAILCVAWSQLADTPSKRVTKNLYDMVAAFENQDAAKVMSYFSPQANLPSGLESTMKDVKVRDHLRITDVSVTMTEQNSLARLHFRANGGFVYRGLIPVNHFATRWEFDWQKEGNDWKVVEFRRLHLMTGKEVDLLSGP